MKSEFSISRITKNEAAPILEKYHYLSKESKGFKSGFNYGLFKNKELVGVCIFTPFPVPELVVSMFGLNKNEQDGMFELSRLCLVPEVQESEYNITSWFVSRCIKQLRKDTKVRCILSYADTRFHKGTIYAACNFEYYGLTPKKKDFYFKTDNGYVKHSRGKVKGKEGIWIDRPRKHRFVMIFDEELRRKMKWEKVSWKEAIQSGIK